MNIVSSFRIKIVWFAQICYALRKHLAKKCGAQICFSSKTGKYMRSSPKILHKAKNFCLSPAHMLVTYCMSAIYTNTEE